MKTTKTVSISVMLLALFLTSNALMAKEPHNKEAVVTVTSYGIYAHSPDNGKTWINPLSEKKIDGHSSSPVHLSSTRSIPAQYPLFFGFEYEVNNLTTGTVELTTEVTHPKIKLANGSYSTQYQQLQTFLVIDGKITATCGYLLENIDEIQAGNWLFKIKRQGQTIITQGFTVKAN